MGGMGHPRRGAACVVSTVLAASLLAGCTRSTRRAPGPDVAPAAAAGAGRGDGVGGRRPRTETRTELETEVGGVLSDYVVEAFLGDFPREEFVQAFGSFTSGAARSAAGDIEQLTAARVQDATAVTATRLDARLSFLVAASDVVGATAALDLAFDATMPDGSTRPLSLRGRFLLERADGDWSSTGTTSRSTTARGRGGGDIVRPRRWAGWVLVAAVAASVPGPSVQPASISLTTVETARTVDFGDGVYWVLALGSDARPGTEVTEGNTDAIQLIGVDPQRGSGRRHRDPAGLLGAAPRRVRPHQRRARAGRTGGLAAAGARPGGHHPGHRAGHRLRGVRVHDRRDRRGGRRLADGVLPRGRGPRRCSAVPTSSTPSRRSTSPGAGTWRAGTSPAAPTTSSSCWGCWRSCGTAPTSPG